MDVLFEALIANWPNLIGLALLAWLQWQTILKLLELVNKLVDVKLEIAAQTNGGNQTDRNNTVKR